MFLSIHSVNDRFPLFCTQFLTSLFSSNFNAIHIYHYTKLTIAPHVLLYQPLHCSYNVHIILLFSFQIFFLYHPYRFPLAPLHTDNSLQPHHLLIVTHYIPLYHFEHLLNPISHSYENIISFRLSHDPLSIFSCNLRVLSSTPPTTTTAFLFISLGKLQSLSLVHFPIPHLRSIQPGMYCLCWSSLSPSLFH